MQEWHLCIYMFTRPRLDGCAAREAGLFRLYPSGWRANKKSAGLCLALFDSVQLGAQVAFGRANHASRMPNPYSSRNGPITSIMLIGSTVGVMIAAPTAAPIKTTRHTLM